jgi:muramidase (phage lysozyme)
MTSEEQRLQELLIQSMQQLTHVIAGTSGNLGSLSGAAGTTAAQLQNAATSAAETSNRNKRSSEEEWKAKSNLNTAIYQSEAMFRSFASEMLSTKTEFNKFNRGLSSAGDAVWSVSKNFGLLGFAVGGLVKGITKLVELQFEQADAGLKAVDELNKMGAAGSVNTKEFIDLGIATGLTADQLQLLPKAIKKAGDGILSLGMPIGEAQKTFIKMTNVSNETREAFQRLGVSQEELINSQADYLALQALTGKSLGSMTKDINLLRSESLKYTENLINLSAATGKSTEEAASIQKKVALQSEELLRRAARANEYKTAGSERKQQMDAEDESRTKLITNLMGQFDEKTALQIGKIYNTGAFSPGTESLAQLNVPIIKLLNDYKKLKDPKEQNEAIIKISKGLQDAVLAKANAMGGEKGPAQFLSESEREAVGLGTELVKGALKDQTALAEALRNPVRGTEAGRTGTAADEDAAQKARNELTTTTITLNQRFSQLVSDSNILTNQFKDLTKALVGFAGAVGAAVLALGAISAKRALDSVTGGFGGGFSDSGSDAKGKGGLLEKFGKLNKLQKFGIGLAGGGAAAVAGLALGYGADKAKEMGYEKTGAGLSVANKALQYGGIGAMAGSILGPAGTIAGGVLAGGAGALMGLYENRRALFGFGEDDQNQEQNMSGNVPTSQAESSSSNPNVAPVGATRMDSATNLAEAIRAIDAGSKGYNAYNYGKNRGSASKETYDLVHMTLGQVMDLQNQGILNAVGGYQIVPKTMRRVVQALNLSPDETFSPELQDKMYRHLSTAVRPILADYLAGRSNDREAAALALSQEWAAFPVPKNVWRPAEPGQWSSRQLYKGESYYEGVAGNHAQTTVDKMYAILEKEREIRMNGGKPQLAYGGFARRSSGGTDVTIGEPGNPGSYGEAVIPLKDPNSILAKVLLGSPSEVASIIPTTKSTGVSDEMIEAMIYKFDTMISYLSDGVDIQKSILRQSYS